MFYIAKIAFNKTDNVYEVSFPAFRNIFTYGETFTVAKKNAKEALNINIEEFIEMNKNLPKEKKRVGKNYHSIDVEPNNIIAYKLKKLRGKKNLTDMAEKLGIKYQTYQRYENPRTCNPTIKTLSKISETFDLDLKYLVA
jgi:predicted RNase H-like HicB family nuclease